MKTIEIVFVNSDNSQETFVGTAAEIANEIFLRQVLYGRVAYFIPLKVPYLQGVN